MGDNERHNQFEPLAHMPSLIRFLVVVVFLAGLVFAGMVALSVFVDPGQKDITVRVPVKDLLGG